MLNRHHYVKQSVLFKRWHIIRFLLPSNILILVVYTTLNYCLATIDLVDVLLFTQVRCFVEYMHIISSHKSLCNLWGPTCDIHLYFLSYSNLTVKRIPSSVKCIMKLRINKKEWKFTWSERTIWSLLNWSAIELEYLSKYV